MGIYLAPNPLDGVVEEMERVLGDGRAAGVGEAVGASRTTFKRGVRRR